MSDMPGHKPLPRSAGQLLQHWAETKTVLVPILGAPERAQQSWPETTLDVQDTSIPPPGTGGDPDMLVRLKDGRRFYIKLYESQTTFYPLDLPVLYYPSCGVGRSFWVVKDQYELKPIL